MWDILVFCRDVARTALARRRLARELGALSDHLLGDIGLDPPDIAAYVGSGPPWPAPPFRPRARFRPSLRGCG